MKMVGRVGLYLVIGLMLLLLLLPTAISQGATYFVRDTFKKQYAMNLELEKLWINPFSGIVSVGSVGIANGRDTLLLRDLKINIAMLQLIHKKIHIENFSLDGANLQITQLESGWFVNGLMLPKIESSPAIEQVSTDTDGVQPWHISISNLSLSGIVFGLQNSQLNLRAKLQSLSIKSLDTETADKAMIKSRLLIDTLELPHQQIASSFELDLDAALELAVKGREWQAKTIADLEFGNLNLSVQGYDLSADKIAILSTIEGGYIDGIHYQLNSDLNIEELAIRSSESEVVDYLQIASFMAKNFKANSMDRGLITLDKVEIKSLQALPSTEQNMPDLIKDGDILISAIGIDTVDPSGGITVDIDELRLPTATANFMIAVDGEMPQIKIFGESEKNGMDSDNIVKESSTEIEDKIELSESQNHNRFRLHKIVIGPDVVVNFEDQSISPAMEESVKFTLFEMEDIEIPSENNAKINSLLELSHDASFTLNGEFSIDQKTAILDANLKRYELLKVSGYSQKVTGYELESGTISLDSKINIDDRKLDLENTILIDRVNLRAKNSDKALRYANQLTMPLDEALDLLRDGNDQIKLKVPVDGNLDDPNIDFNQVINKALGGAMKKASISALKFMLQPYSTMISVAKFAGEQMSKIRLDPIIYEAGSNALAESSKDYVEKIAAILTTKKSLSVKVCGLTNFKDDEYFRVANPVVDPKTHDPIAYQKQIDKRLNQLSQDRSSGLKRYLVDNFNIEKDRLLTCLPDHSNEKKAVSGIELLL